MADKTTAMTPRDNFQRISGKLQREDWLAGIARAMPAALRSEAASFVQGALAIIRGSNQLQQCDEISIYSALVDSAALGLAIDARGLAYLVPYGKKCTLIIGYKGFIQLAHRSAQIKSIIARPVFRNDVYDVDFSDPDRPITHRPCPNRERGELVAVYCTCHLLTGGRADEWMWRWEIDDIRDASQSYKSAVKYKKDDSPWISDFVAMAVKCPVRKIFKWIPSSATVARALAIDEGAESGNLIEHAPPMLELPPPPAGEVTQPEPGPDPQLLAARQRVRDAATAMGLKEAVSLMQQMGIEHGLVDVSEMADVNRLNELAATLESETRAADRQ